MNFVVVKHPNDSGKYLFCVPEDVELDAGTLVACDTARGANQPGICATSTFHADPDAVCPLWGTQKERLKRVTKVLREHILEWHEELPFSDPNEDEDQFPY